jgi:hypothetical protein
MENGQCLDVVTAKEEAMRRHEMAMVMGEAPERRQFMFLESENDGK